MHFLNQILFVFFIVGCYVNSFPLFTRRYTRTSLLAQDDSSMDFEAARNMLESLVGQAEEKTPTFSTPSYAHVSQVDKLLNGEDELPPPSPLTTIERERRGAEMKLLAELDEGDSAMSDLWDLWYNERGPKAASKLAKAELFTSEGPLGWPEAERILKELIVEHGFYFTEPVNRLATLYYLQDRLEESEKLCYVVLKSKPWHFGALSGLVMVHAGLRNVNAARLWASRRLPSFNSQGPNQRRVDWVVRALRDAEDSLERAENRMARSFGKRDRHMPQPKRTADISSDVDDAWQ